MTVLITWELPIKPDLWEEARRSCAENLGGTRSFSGCQKIDIYRDKNTGSMVLIEYWDSVLDYQKYVQWRKETGVLGDFVSDFASGEPALRILDLMEG